jgi:hypothetical protein
MHIAAAACRKLSPSFRARRCDVDAFSYLSVLLSIILGLAITQILQGLRRLMQARSRLRVYALGGDVGAAAARRRCAVVGAMSDLRTVEHWSFVAFGVVVMHTICLYRSPRWCCRRRSRRRADRAARALLGPLPLVLRVRRAERAVRHRQGSRDLRPPAAHGQSHRPAVVRRPRGIAARTRREGYHRLLAPASVLGFVGYIAQLD